jgi:hypothetical protein
LDLYTVYIYNFYFYILHKKTPLHLASLRGHSSVVEYLIVDYAANFSKRDKNGLTPLELTIKKKQIKAEWVIRKFSSRNTFDLVRKLGIQRLKDTRFLNVIIYLFLKILIVRIWSQYIKQHQSNIMHFFPYFYIFFPNFLHFFF